MGHAANPVISRVYEGRTLNDQRPSMGVVVSPHRERLSSKMLDKITPDGVNEEREINTGIYFLASMVFAIQNPAQKGGLHRGFAP